MSDDPSPDLPAAWRALAARVGAPAPTAAAIGRELVRRHAEPHRRYHDLRHVADVLDRIEEILAAGAAAEDPDAIRLAAWFHDAVYDPTASDNEQASAALAVRLLALLGVGPDRRERVARLVRATVDHLPRDLDEAVLCDADLSILAAAPADYDAYAAAVRAEHTGVDDDGWRAGRGAVLRALLTRPALYATAPMAAAEARARANIARELTSLDREPGS